MRRNAPRFLILGVLTVGLVQCSSTANDDTGQSTQAVVHYGSDGCDWYYGICSTEPNAPPEGATIDVSADGTWTVVDADAGTSSTSDGTGSMSTGTSTSSATCPPEPTTLDDAGQPRDAAGHIRFCWPGEANCSCDRDNDCYALDGYVACTSTSTGTDAGTVTDAGSGTDSGSSTTTCSHEATTLDDAGQPRNASGQIRFCWPGEANCVCDRDNDCYALDGYVACSSTGGTPTTDAGSGTDASTPPPTDSGTSGTNAGTDVLPAFDSATDAHVRSVIATGVSLGNRRTVFAKIGDSITESASFLSDIGYGWYTLGNHADLLPTIQQFSSVTFGDGSNSFNRASISAVAGWTTDDALAGGSSSPLVRELDAIHPMFAIVMYGTNDIEKSNLSTYAANMNTIVDTIEAHGTVAILSTIPPRTDDATRAAMVPDFNTVVRNLAATRHLPLIDLNIALSTLPGDGLSSDGVHPNLYLDQGGTLTDVALQYGYNVRNLTALQMLQRMTAY